LSLDACKQSRKELFLKNTIQKIVYTKASVFEDANVDTLVFIIDKGKQKERSYYQVIEFSKGFKIVEKNLKFNQNDLKDSYEVNLDSNDILKKVYNNPNSVPITSIVEIYNGIATGPNKQDYFSDTKISDNYKPLLLGNDVHKFFNDKSTIWINYDRQILHRARNENIFLAKEKIIMQRIRNLSLKDRLVATIDYNQHYTFNSVNNILIMDKNYDIRYVLSILNSKLINFLFKKISSNTNITSQDFSKLPFIDINKNKDLSQQPFIEKVDQILTLKQTNPSADTSLLEREIDLMVYELYGLSEEEIGVVEGK
jgi:hypothetical protein